MEKPSGLNRIRTAIGAIAALGVVSGTELPKDGGLPQMQQAEAAETFNAEREAQRLLEKIDSFHSGDNTDSSTRHAVDKARARQTEMLFGHFADVLESKNEKGSGRVSPDAMKRAIEYLTPLFNQFISERIQHQPNETQADINANAQKYVDAHPGLGHLAGILRSRTPVPLEEMNRRMQEQERQRAKDFFKNNRNPRDPQGPSGQVTKPGDL